MKKIIIYCLIGVGLFISPCLATEHVSKSNKQQTTETVVYVTNTGSKYHRESCSSLSKSKIKTTKNKAIADGLGACGKCKP